MKATGHPIYYPEAKVVCACGNTFTVGSTKDHIGVEICAKCHPFFTGEVRFVDAMGRVERFQQKVSATVGKIVVSKKQKKILKKRQEDAEEAARPKTIREMLERVRAKV